MVHQGKHPCADSRLWDEVHTAAALRTARHWARRWARGRRGRADQEDMVQDILLAALRRTGHFDANRASWTTFIDLVARHVVADRRATDQRAARMDQALAALAILAQPEPDEELAGALRRGLGLQTALTLLPYQQQHMLALLIAGDGDVAATCRRSGRSTSAFYRDLDDLRFWLRSLGLAPRSRGAGKNRGVDR